MIIDIKIPAVGESIKEATLAQWLKHDGDSVHKNEPILVIETDKVTLEIVAEADGILHVQVPEGQVVPIGTVVGTLSTETISPVTATDQQSTDTVRKDSSAPQSEDPQKIPAPSVQPSTPVTDSFQNGFLLPSVRRLAKEQGVDISTIVGTGPDGKITKGDVLLHLESQSFQNITSKPPAAQTEPTASLPIPDEPVIRKTLTPIRQRIAARLVEAKQQTAMLTTFNEIDMSRVMAIRTEYKDVFLKKHGVSLGFMSFFIRACIAALKEVPEINAYIDGKDIIYHDYYHIGVAVGSQRGLVVPVIRHADRMGFAGIEKAIEEAVGKINSGNLKLSDLEGGTFTISNGGVYGSLLSTPILNPPQSGILGMHKIEKRPVVVQDAIVIRPMMYVALSYDHRIVDGKGAVTCLKRIKECIEEPERLLMEI